ncbi:hypothetical protein [Streptomyces sp. NPDC088246]|uniref:hypothetical protein n=1 Tax=Streptomyces sp. NPDC088246 TaxID=3365842 RepID=UPI003829CB6D
MTRAVGPRVRGSAGPRVRGSAGPLVGEHSWCRGASPAHDDEEIRRWTAALDGRAGQPRRTAAPDSHAGADRKRAAPELLVIDAVPADHERFG